VCFSTKKKKRKTFEKTKNLNTTQKTKMSSKKKKGSSFAAYANEPPKPSLFGGFTQPPIITSDADPEKTDPYILLEPIPSRHLGKNFTTTPARKGHGPDAFFGHKFLTMASAEQNRQFRNEAKKKNIGDSDFKYVSFPKKSTGPGSYYGTIGNKAFEHMKDYTVPTKDDPPPDINKHHEPRNIICNPPKKGTYGVPGTTFGPKLEHKGDGFEETRALEKAAWEAEKKKRLGGVWKISLKSHTTFDERGATGVSAVFDAYEKPPEKPKKKRKKKEKQWPGKPLVHPAVFKYTSPPKQGTPGYFGGFPNKRDEGMEDPYNAGPRTEEELNGGKKKKKKRGKKDPKPLVHDSHWKPTSGDKTSVVRSLLRRFF
jgi:hypothetical protein